MPDDFYGPIRPALGWAVLGVALAAAVIGWYCWVWWTTRPPRRHSQRELAAPTWTVEARRAAALAELDQLEAAHAAGQITARELFQRLSPLVRRYVYETSGAPVHVRSLDDLRADTDPMLASTVEWMYPEEFAAWSPGAVAEGLARARWYLTRTPGDGGSHAPTVHQ